MSYLPTRKPTKQELENCVRYDLTSSNPWDPNEALASGSIDDEDWGLSILSSSKRDLMPLELYCDTTDHVISCLERLGVPCLTPPHEADVLAHEAERQAAAISRDTRQSTITDEILASWWQIGLKAAARTLQTTTQEGMRFIQGPMERRLKTSQAHLRYPIISITVYLDTMFPSMKSIRGYTCAQVFTDGHGFVRVYPLKKKGDAHHALVQFIQDVGIPKSLLTDNAPEEVRGEWRQVVRKYHIKPRTTKPASPWQNQAEAEIREIKKLTRRIMKSTSAPLNLWCYALEWAAKIRSLTAHDLFILGARTPEERITGRTPDISEYAHFDWLQWVWFREPSSFPEHDIHLGRWLGIAHDVRQAMTFWVLTGKNTIVARSSVTALTPEETRDEQVKSQQEAFMEKLKQRNQDVSSSDTIDIFPDLTDDNPEFTMLEADDYSPESYDEYLHAQVVLPLGGELR
jgi:hypothetical protein